MTDVQRLLNQATGDGIAKLPVLSAAELWVLCGDQQVLADEAEARWWAGLTDGDRDTYATAMVDFLVHRELVRRPEDPGSTKLPMTAELAMIVAARQLPSVVVVCEQEGWSAAAPRMYGLAQVGHSPRALLSEVVSPPKEEAFGPMHHFALVSPERAGTILANWSTAKNSKGFLSRKPKTSHRVIDVYHHRSGEDLTRTRLEVDADGAAVELTRQQAGGEPEPPVRLTTSELAGRLTGLLLEPVA